MEHLAVQKGDFVIFQKNESKIIGGFGGHCFSFRDATRFPLKLSGTLSPALCEILIQNIKSALVSMKTGGFEMISHPAEDLPIMLLAAKERISKCSLLYQQGDFTAASTELTRLIGLGIGHSSGTDTLCGVLFALQLASSSAAPPSLCF